MSKIDTQEQMNGTGQDRMIRDEQDEIVWENFIQWLFKNGKWELVVSFLMVMSDISLQFRVISQSFIVKL